MRGRERRAISGVAGHSHRLTAVLDYLRTSPYLESCFNAISFGSLLLVLSSARCNCSENSSR